jgi:hypothetical protein
MQQLYAISVYSQLSRLNNSEMQRNLSSLGLNMSLWCVHRPAPCLQLISFSFSGQPFFASHWMPDVQILPL